ncbi:MAG TPA: 2-amino-4-hydroxy-6-hydroxymethyldihydropteridine diphosphokinase [Vicinamibacterales bacterium]|nr:2-amino-4-hydroxy-6-hydroxymethyldihydropteridine diphosphokinase [Vicinamibacterales bacterium]
MSSILAAVALGSNDGDRAAHLDFAVERLRSLLQGLVVSDYRETPPEPPADPLDTPFLNAAVVGRTSLSARALLDELLAIERARGRERPHSGAPRTLDVDLVLLGDQVIRRPGLEVPHPRFRERTFVLEPLSQIAPDLVDPVTGLTVRELLKGR